MIKPIMKDITFLKQKSEIATKEDLSVADDLLDTLKANSDGCVGMAANMIGSKKQIIIFQIDFYPISVQVSLLVVSTQQVMTRVLLSPISANTKLAQLWQLWYKVLFAYWVGRIEKCW